MPSCKNCFLADEEKLENACCYFVSRHSLVLFLLNVILNIQKMWFEFCTCDGKNICLSSEANICYREYQYSIYNQCLNLDFLTKVKENLYYNLSEMIKKNNHFVCKIINNQFYYENISWFNGHKYEYSLENTLLFFEQKMIDKIINNDFKINISKCS